MKGTEKQISWAKEIKAGYVAKLESIQPTLEAKIEKHPAKVDMMKAFEELKNWELENACTYIEHKNDVVGAVLLDSKNKSKEVYTICSVLINAKLI